MNDRDRGRPETLQAASAEAGGTAVSVNVRKLATLAVWAIATVLALRFFTAVKVVLLGVLAAAAVACLLRPAARRLPWHRGLSAVVVGVGFVAVLAGLLAGIGLLVAKPVGEQLKNLPDARQSLDASLRGLSGRFDVSPPVDTGTLLSQAGSLLGSVGSLAATTGQAVIGVAVALALVLIGSIYLLAEPRDELLGPVLPALPPHGRAQLTAALDELEPKLRGWLLGTMVSMACVGLVSWAGYALAGLKFAIPLALVAALGELVPTVGPILGGVVAVLFATTQGSGQVAGAVATWAVVQTLESYVITPLVMRRAVKMPAIVTLFSVILWGEVFGAAGLLMAVPLNLLLWSHFKHLVMGGNAVNSARDRSSAGRGGSDDDLSEAEAHPT
ncbi:MAG: hypothetical protein JWO31_4037 [Phycisphaerales bacterium]|nr:hypothetical protein [Phycisphaerales bacterium]